MKNLGKTKVFEILLSFGDSVHIQSSILPFGKRKGTDTGFGIWDLPQKITIKAKIGPLGQNLDFFGTIFGPFRDF